MTTETLRNLDEARLSPKLLYTTFVAAMGAFLDGYDLAIIAGALLLITPQFALSSGTVGVVGGIVFAGMIVGALLFGRITDKVGRRAAFLVVLALFVVGSLLSAFATNVALLIAGRLLVGLGIGADLPISTSMIAEFSPRRWRGSLTGVMQTFWFGGACGSAIVAAVLFSALGENSWRWMLGSGAFLAILVMILRMWIPESPRWLLRDERPDAAQSAVASEVREEDYGSPGDQPEAQTSGELPETDTTDRLNTLLSTAFRGALLFAMLFWFLQTIRGAAFNLYTPTFLSEVGLAAPTAALWLNSVIFGAQAAVALLAAVYIDKIGRRSLVLIAWSIATALTIVMAFVGQGSAIPLFTLILLSSLPINVVAVAMFPMSVEFFPTALRGTAQGISSASGKFGGVLAAFAFPVVLAALDWLYTTLALSAVMLVGLVIGFTIKLTDVRNRSLEDIIAGRDKELSDGSASALAERPQAERNN